MRTLSLLLTLLIQACTPRASSQEPAVSASFSVEATLGAGGALSLADLDGALAVGTTRGVAVFDGGVQRWFVAAPAWVRSVAAGGGRVAFAANDGTIGVLDGASGAAIRSLAVGRSAAVALSPDGARLAVGQGAGGVQIYEVATGAVVGALSGFTWEIVGLAWSPDGAALAAADGRGAVRLLRGEVVIPLEGAATPTMGLAWSPDGARVAVGGRPVTLWDASTGARVRQIEPEVGRPEDLAFSPDGAVLAGGRDKGQVDLWTVADGALVRTVEASTSSAPRLVWARPDRIWMGAGALSSADPSTGARAEVLPLVMTPTAVQVMGGVLALRAADGVALFDATTLAPLGAAAAASGGLTLLDGGGGQLFAAEARGLSALDPATGALTERLQVSGLGAAAVKPGGGALAGATYGQDKVWSVAVWDLSTGAERWRAPVGRVAPTTVAFSSDGAAVVAHTRDAVQVYDAGTGAPIGSRAQAMLNRSGLALSPTAPLAASVMTDRELEVWDLRSGKTSRRLGRLGGEGGWLLVWSPDGEKLAATAKDKAGDKVYVSDRAGGLGGILAGTPPSAVVHGLAWSPDHALLAGAVGTTPNQGLVLVWSSSGALVHREEVASATPNAVAWSADGSRIFAALGDGSALVLRRSP